MKNDSRKQRVRQPNTFSLALQEGGKIRTRVPAGVLREAENAAESEKRSGSLPQSSLWQHGPGDFVCRQPDRCQERNER